MRLATLETIGETPTQWTLIRRQHLQQPGWIHVCEGQARIVRESKITKPYGWIFLYRSKEFLDDGTPSAQLARNAPIIVRVTGTAKPLEHYLTEYEKTLSPISLQQTPQLPTW
jgi:immunity protein 35 of polymorphic toxin system